MKKELTDRRREIYDYIRSVVDRRGMPPTIREIGEAFGIRSTNGVEGHLAALERSGMIRRERGKSRGILLGSAQRSPVAVPMLGRVAAGQPLLAPENRDGEVMVDAAVFSIRSTSTVFALQVKGESMIDAHILDGDILLVRAQKSAQNGEIVVALVDGETTVKRFFHEKDRVRLQPENSALKPIIVERGEFQILGKAIGVIRKVKTA